MNCAGRRVVHRAPQEQLVLRAGEPREHLPERVADRRIGIDVRGAQPGTRVAVEPDDVPLAVVAVERLDHAVEDVGELRLALLGGRTRRLLVRVESCVVDRHAGAPAELLARCGDRAR